ncbi:SDR family oxidoreductase [Dehalococcoidia bacterium]|nr:SDR family oxidoreductase [Dehalococcoidia bacterium]
MDFKGKTVIVTGSGLGIGRAAVVAFAREGANVVIVDVDSAASNETVEMITSLGRNAGFIKADVSRSEEAKAMVDETIKAFGSLDILVNNAGIYRKGAVLDASEADWDAIMAVNLKGVFLCSKYSAEAMSQRGGGVIVNVASEAGLVGIAGQVAYNVSKAGVIGLTRSCAVDLAAKGVRVNCICPGTTATPLVEKSIGREPDPTAARQHLESVRPLNRLGTPDEIARGILCLASDGMAYATGAVLSVDGGYTAQ